MVAAVVWSVGCELARILVHQARLFVPDELIVFHVGVAFLLWCVYCAYVGAPFCIVFGGLLFLSSVLLFVVDVYARGVFTRILARQARLFALFVRAVYVPCLFCWLRHLVFLVLFSGVYRCTKPTFMQSVGALLASTLSALSCFCRCLIWLFVA